MPNLQEITEKVRTGLGDQITIYSTKGDHRLYAVVEPGKLLNCIQYLFTSLGGRLSTITAMDKGSRFELVYHITFDREGVVGSFKCAVPKFAPQIVSLTSITPAASWIEREIYDLFGIKFTGHPNLERLILSDDWPEDKHPLRKGA